ncbi:uncharacterized protein LOC115207015 [Salmo trutta]|uniref:uncharacterized protein LOC115207015 n=1 Tax=Salmo trutta TaxID=8032 RepID=UPI00113033AC|nr:uncharacterized protein LOC115207015 [Salmo trutta]
MANNYNVPPRFDEKRSYESWKNELGIWTRVTNLDGKKQALAVVLSLEGRARDTALEISVEDLNNDDGMGTLIRALDSVFLKEEKDRAYEAYSNFDSVSRDISVAMTDYIIDFEQRYNRMRKYDMVLPDAVLAFKLLDTACLDGREKQLALTACTVLTFASMKSALKIIFGEKTSVAPLTDGMQASDGAYYTEQQRKGAKKSRSQDNLKRAPFPGTNPLDKYGRRSKCAVCQSTYHWVKDCPHKNEQVKLTEENVNTDIEQCNITLFSNESASDTEIFIVESLGSAVIDTACTRTVCGAKWLDSYVSELNMKEVQNMIDTPSNRAFKFGDGRIVHSTKRVKIPAKIGQTKCHIETEVVPTDIPLLLSKASLKKAGAVLDIKNDKAVMFKQPVTLELTTSGHYCVNILDKDITQSPCKNEIRTDTEHMEILTVTENMNSKEKHKVLLKLHKQFGHATVDRLQKLLSSSGNNDDESISILQQIVNNCETCQKYSKPKPKPAVGLPLASKYETGNKVYYKRVDCQEWKGPGVVIGQDGVVIFVRHGGIIVRVHHSRLRKVNDQQDRGAVAENHPNEKETVTDTNLPDVISNDMDTETDTGNGAETFKHATDNTVERSNEENIQQQPHVLRQHGCSNLKTGQTVKYMDRESGIPHTATVIGRAGKAKGKHQNWYNLQYSEPVTCR